jgi:hypothetical protein
VTILAHGGQLTGDEMALIGGGIGFALLFPVVVLVVAARRVRSSTQPEGAELLNCDDDVASMRSEPTTNADVAPNDADLDISRR